MNLVKRFYDLNIWVRLLLCIWAMLVLVWTSMIGWAVYEQRRLAVEQAISFSGTMNEMTLAGLTTLMITGTMGQRDAFLDQIKELNDLRDLRVLRGDGVSRQFGPGSTDSAAIDAVERQVLASGEPFVQVEPGGQHLRAVFPARNQRDYLGKSCVACHAAASEGEVLGAVSMRVSLEAVNASVQRFGLAVFSAAVLLSLPLLGVVYWFISRFVTIPLRAMTSGLRDIASGGGDLTRRLPVRGGDEIGQASTAFNDMMGKLHELIRRMVGSAGQLSQAAERVSRVSEQTSQEVDRQRSEIQQLATAMNEMAATAQEVARNAQHAAEAARAGSEAASHGGDVIRRTVTGIESLAADVQSAAAVIRKLAADSQQIDNILDLIRGIAEQTNLLSLNAAIEAARAGETGRGFAVVAGEVRALSKRTHDATAQIQAMIQQLQADTAGAAEVMERGHDQAEAMVAQAGDAGQALESITGAVDTINDVNTQIASAAEEQSAVAEEINRNITIINDVANRSAAGASETAAAGDELARLAQELRRLVGEFKV